MADPISDQCYDLAVGLYACHDASIEDCGTIRQLVEGLENELLAARARIAKLERGLAQLVLEEDAEFDSLQDRLERFDIMPTQAALDAEKETP